MCRPTRRSPISRRVRLQDEATHQASYGALDPRYTPKISFQAAYDDAAHHGSASSRPTPNVAQPNSNSASDRTPYAAIGPTLRANPIALCSNDSRSERPSNSAANGTNVNGSDTAMPTV